MYVDDFSLNLCSPDLDYMMHTIPVYPLPLVSSLEFLEFATKKEGKWQWFTTFKPHPHYSSLAVIFGAKNPFFLKKLLNFPHFISFGEHVKIGLCTGYTFYGVVQKLSSIKLKSALGGEAHHGY